MKDEILFPWIVFAHWIVSAWIENADQEGKIFKYSVRDPFSKKMPIIWPIRSGQGNIRLLQRKHHVEHRQRSEAIHLHLPDAPPFSLFTTLKKT